MQQYAFYEVDGRLYRRSFRFPLEAPVNVLQGSTRFAFGSTLNISRDGVAVKVLPMLSLTTKYDFYIQGFGRLNGTVMRKFDAYCFGVKFNISEDAKKRLDRALAELVGISDGDGAGFTRAAASETAAL